MKTSIKTLTTICTVIISLSVTAQRNHNGGSNSPQPQNQPQPQNHPQPNQHNNNHGWSGNNHHPNWGGSVNIHIGGFPNNYYNNYGYGGGYGYNNNYYSIKKAARNSIRQSANVIGQALQFSDWNDTYSPWLAKAIRHQQYAKQLYFWGDYSGALNHAERAGFLAWNTLSYFNNAYGYDDGFAGNNYPNPYSDPNNPYYKQNNPNTTTQPNTSSDEDFGYRKGNTNTTTEESGSVKRENQSAPANAQKVDKAQLDGSLPQSKLNDRELLKTNVKDLDIE